MRERAVLMVREHAGEHAAPWAERMSIATKIDCTPQTLHNWVAQAERDRACAAASDERVNEGHGARDQRAAIGRCAARCGFLAYLTDFVLAAELANEAV